MPEVTEITVAKAQKEFLGRQPIIGIGKAENRDNCLSFIFASESAKMRLGTRRWARRHHIRADVHVAGASLEAATSD